MAKTVLICGSRNWTNQAAIWDRIRNLPLESTIITGGARGADSIAANGAEYFGLASRVIPANWDRYGKRAGFLRNLQMLDEKPDLVIAFQKDGSKGTQHTIDEAMKRGIPVEIQRG